MKTLLAFIALLTLPIHATQTGEWLQSLDGPWKFTTTFDPKPADWTDITVPGNWESTEKHKDFRGIGWYRRSFTPNASHKGKHLRLRFDAVYHESEVFLNGQRLGKHIGGYTPFEFDVTDKVDFAKPNTVTVRADNTYQRGAWWPWGGISRSVHLIANNPVRLEWQHIHTDPNLRTGTAAITVNYRIHNTGDTKTTVDVRSKLLSNGPDIVSKSIHLKAGETNDLRATFTLPADQVRLWHFDRPNLYHLHTTLNTGGEVTHTKTDRFGIRKIAVTPTSLLLNGEPVRLVGFNRVSDDSGKSGNTEPDELINRDVDLMKRCGATMSRIMHYPQAPNLLDRLDEKGMLVICEIPVWQHDPQIITDNPITREWLTAMIHRDYNHPCIIGWSIGNEMYDFYPYASSMMKFVREELDSNRLVTYASHLAFRTGTGEPIEETDIALINFYNDWSKHTAVMAGRWPDKPIFVSEFGLKQLEPHGHFKEGFIDQWEKLTTSNSRLVGASLWTFNDYRSDYKGTPETGFRSWGVVDQNRKLKPAYYTLRKLFSPVRTLAIEGNTVTIQTRAPEQTPSYTLTGYSLQWKNGAETGTIEIPTLKPGAPAWTTKLPDHATGEKLVVKLVSPLGYDVDDTLER